MGAVPLLLAAFERSYPSWNVAQWLSPYGKTVVAANGNDCLAGSLVQNTGIQPSSLEAYPGSLLDNSQFNDLMTSMSPLGTSGVPQTPILFYQSAIDELAPVSEMEQLAGRYCSEGLPVQVVLSPAGEHIASVITDFPIALSYLSARFAGAPAPDGVWDLHVIRRWLTNPRALPWPPPRGRPHGRDGSPASRSPACSAIACRTRRGSIPRWCPAIDPTVPGSSASPSRS